MERVTSLEIIRKATGESPEEVLPALREIKEWLGVPVYFAHPYSSFERGTNENHNGIIRRFIPKGKSIDDISDSLVERVQAFMNNLPRKRFGYQTPLEHMANLLACS